MSNDSSRPRSAAQSETGIQIETDSPRRSGRSRRRKKSSAAPAIAITVALIAAVGGAGWWFLNQETEQPAGSVTLTQLDPLTLPEGEPFRVTTAWELDGLKQSEVRFRVRNAPEGVTIDELTGELSWTPTEEQGPGTYDLIVRAVREDSGDELDSTSVQMTVTEVGQPPSISDVPPIEVKAGETATHQVIGVDADVPASDLHWKITQQHDAADATIDPQSGLFSWTPAESSVADDYRFTIQVAKANEPTIVATTELIVTVRESMSPTQKLIAGLAARGVRARSGGVGEYKPFTVPAERVSVNDSEMRVFQYDDATVLRQDLAKIGPEAKTLGGTEVNWLAVPHFFSDLNTIVLYEGDEPAVLAALSDRFGKPFLVGEAMSLGGPDQAKPGEPTPMEAKLLAMYDSGELFRTNNYRDLRTLYASQFAGEYEPTIRSALGDDADAMLAWFEQHPDIREEFYLAIDPEADDVAAAAKLFNELRYSYPDQLENYGNLAIAIALTWDRPRAVYDYTGHQRRTHSIMPEELADAMANFDYFLKAEPVMQGRAKFLPWEFQIHMVNHRTPVTERQWALQGYLAQRPMVGKIYSTVPYDTVMLNTESEVCRLDGKPYSLSNILNFGGVCAMQADFAARVGKSLGVPAEYVSGQGRYGGAHAWVMWVEILSVNNSGIRFSLESHGRYRGDRYYVGNLRDPQTGRGMTDREMELKLQTVGNGVIPNRMANLIMRSMPLIARHREWTLSEQLKYIENVLKLSPSNENAWRSVAKLASTPELDRKQQKRFMNILNQFFGTFTNFPDFTWKIFGDLVQFEQDEEKQTELYARLTALYEGAGRPDLASKARLVLTDRLLAAEKLKEASQGLGFTILRFADEGRFVVGLLDRLEEIAKTIEGSEKELTTFYLAFLSKIPQKRGGTPSKYCIQMYERAITRFETLNRPDLAQQLRLELQRIQAG